VRRHTAIPFLSSINLGEWQELAAIWQLRAKATGPYRLWPDSTTGLPDASQRHLTPRYGVGVVLATKASARVAGAAEHTPRPRAYVNAGVGSFRRRGARRQRLDNRPPLGPHAGSADAPPAAHGGEGAAGTAPSSKFTTESELRASLLETRARPPAVVIPISYRFIGDAYHPVRALRTRAKAGPNGCAYRALHG
jgi:hypothetical protein